jgi:hypothetical protein
MISDSVIHVYAMDSVSTWAEDVVEIGRACL